MHSTRPLTRLVLVLALGLSGAAGAESEPEVDAGSAAKPGGLEPAAAAAAQASPQASAEAPQAQIDAWLAAARALKAERPELFGEADGVLATLVVPGGQGAGAGIAPGDVLIAYGDTALDSAQQLITLTAETLPETVLTLRWLRPDGDSGARLLEASSRGGRIGVGIVDITENLEFRIKSLLARAHNGDSDAQFVLGSMFHFGLETEQDHKAARHWYTLAARQNHRPAQMNLAMLCEQGLGGERSYDTAKSLYLAVADAGEGGSATPEATVLVQNPKTLAGRVSGSFSPVSIQAEAEFRLGVMFESGHATGHKNATTAALWYKRAAEHGHPQAQTDLGYLYEYGIGVSQDDQAAVYWYGKAAEQGYNYGQRNLGMMYARGRGVPQDNALAIQWVEKAAQQGHSQAQFDLGSWYRIGSMGLHDDVQALRWIRESAKQGYPDALNDLGAMYLGGDGVPKDLEQATFWLEQALKKGVIVAAGNLAVAYNELGRHEEIEKLYASFGVASASIPDPTNRARYLRTVAVGLLARGNFNGAAQALAEAVEVDRSLRDKEHLALDLMNYGIALRNLGRQDEALQALNASLILYEPWTSNPNLTAAINNRGVIYQVLARYDEARKDFEMAKELSRQSADKKILPSAESNLCILYQNLDLRDLALASCTASVQLMREVQDEPGLAKSLDNLGNLLSDWGQCAKALSLHSESRRISERRGDLDGQARAALGLNLVYSICLGDAQGAERYADEALELERRIGDPVGIANALRNKGVTLSLLGRISEASAFYKESLIIEAQGKEPDSAWIGWFKLSVFWSSQAKLDPAILAAKRAVQIIQTIRSANTGLNVSEQRSLFVPKAHVYRHLADMLLTRKRYVEAQRVLDMLKEQELYDYLNQEGAHDPRRIRVEFTDSESAWNRVYNDAETEVVRISARLNELNRSNFAEEEIERSAEINRLGKERDVISQGL